MGLSTSRAFLNLVREATSFVLTTHVQPDGDGIGSQIALASLIRILGAEVRIINTDPIPHLLRDLESEVPIEVYEPEVHDGVLRDADVIVMLDSSVTSRLGAILDAIKISPARRACIDHHPEPDPFWEILLLDTTASSTGEMVFRLYEEQRQAIPALAAVAMYFALVSDTGRFRFRNTSAPAFHMAARLVEAGAEPAESFARLEEQHTEGYLRLYGEVLSALESRAEGRLVILRVPLEAIRRHRAETMDLSDIINRSLSSSTARIAALFRERADGQTKISLRSKGSLDVNRLARQHGGGGHRNASGIVVDATMEQTIERLLPNLLELASG